MYLKMSSGVWQPLWLGLSVLSYGVSVVSILWQIDCMVMGLHCSHFICENFRHGKTKSNPFYWICSMSLWIHYLWYNQIKPDHFVAHSRFKQWIFLCSLLQKTIIMNVFIRIVGCTLITHHLESFTLILINFMKVMIKSKTMLWFMETSFICWFFSHMFGLLKHIYIYISLSSPLYFHFLVCRAWYIFGLKCGDEICLVRLSFWTPSLVVAHALQCRCGTWITEQRNSLAIQYWVWAFDLV